MARIDWDSFEWSSFATGWGEDLRVAASFFTRLPLAYPGPLTGEALGRALRAWPLVGLALGAAGGLLYAVAEGLGLTPLASALLALALLAAATGAMHEDGLADFADGLGGSEAAERLAIMRDNRTGAYGTLALILGVGLRAAALAEIASPAAAAAALAAAAAASRGMAAVLPTLLAPARSDGLGAMLGAPRQESALGALALAIVLAILLLPFHAAISGLVLALVAVLALAELARRQLGGFTGDVMGAAQQAAETVMLLVVAAFA